MTKIHPYHEAILAAKKNLLPGLILQIFMIGILVAYFLDEPTRQRLEIIAQWKKQCGYLFSFFVSAIIAGILPEIFRIVCFRNGKVRLSDLHNMIFGFFYWGGIGLLVDFFYRCQIFWFGDSSNLRIIILKACVDMFLFTPWLTCPLGVVLYRWRDRRYRFSAFTEVIHPGFFRYNIFPVIVACWVVWIPIAFVIYAMPGPLQFPICVTAEVFWVLLLITITEMQMKRDDVNDEKAMSGKSSARSDILS